MTSKETAMSSNKFISKLRDISRSRSRSRSGSRSRSTARSHRNRMSQKSAVIVPLYIYPFPGVWHPLHEAISNHPDLQFVVIINPHDGPGAGDFPDHNYVREIQALNAYANVLTVGYVRVDYCKRAMDETCRDIRTYAGWAEKGLGMHGIFFDETPNLFTTSVATYLKAVDEIVKGMFGILGDRLVIHNPGTIPDAGLATPGPDVAAVFEASYAEYRSEAIQLRLASLLPKLPFRQDRCAYFVHSVPVEEMKRLVLELRHRGQYLFATDNTENFYVKFGPSWREFIAAMQME